MMNTIGIALSGLLGAAKKAEASANNIANMHTTGHLDGTTPAPYNAVTATSQSTPFANNQGYVGTPTVDLAEEAVNLSIAEAAYKANLAVLRTADEMQDELLKSFDREV
jgi:flagellar basal body rod protein FlgC